MESHLKMRENENVWWAAQPPEVSTVQCLEPVNEPYVAKGTSQVFSRVRTREGAIDPVGPGDRWVGGGVDWKGERDRVRRAATRPAVRLARDARRMACGAWEPLQPLPSGQGRGAASLRPYVTRREGPWRARAFPARELGVEGAGDVGVNLQEV